MRLTLKLAVGVLVAVALTLVVSVVLRTQRERGLIVADIGKNHLVLGNALAIDIVDRWRDEGHDGAFRLVTKINSEHDGMELSAHDVGALGEGVVARLRENVRVQEVTGEPGEEHLVTFIPLIQQGRLLAVLQIDEPLAAARAFTEASLIRTLWAAAGGLVLSSTAAFALGYVVVGRPVRELVRLTRRVGAGDLGYRITTRRRDELGLLAQELNAMCERLGSAKRELERVTDERIAAVQQLRHADRLSTIGLLSAGVAHELGTPLNIVDGRAQMVVAGTGDAKAHALSISQQAQRMTTIVRQLLDFAGARQPNKMRVDLLALARETCDLLRSLAGTRSVALELSGPSVDVEVDAGQAQQALTNVIVNAIHASPANATIAVEVRRGDGAGIVMVKDSGSGMDPDTLTRIFTPFFTTKAPGEGTGLGLAVAWGLVDENGGSITVQSTVDVGTTFQIHLPLGV